MSAAERLESRRELGRVVRDLVLEGSLEPAPHGRYTMRLENGVCGACFVAALVIALDGSDDGVHDIDGPAAEWLRDRLRAHFDLEELALAEAFYENRPGTPLVSLLPAEAQRRVHLQFYLQHELPGTAAERLLWLAGRLAETGEIR